MDNQRITKIKNNQEKYKHILKKHKSILTEQDFYPPSDDRVWMSNVKDIDDGDNFADYCQEFFSLLDEEEYFDNE